MAMPEHARSRLDAADGVVEMAHISLQQARQTGDVVEIERCECELWRARRELRQLINAELDRYEQSLPSATVIPFPR